MKKKITMLARFVVICAAIAGIVYIFYPRSLGEVIKDKSNKWTYLCIDEVMHGSNLSDSGRGSIGVKDKVEIQKMLDYLSNYKVNKPVPLLDISSRMLGNRIYTLIFSNKKDVLTIELSGSRYVSVCKESLDRPSHYKYIDKDMNFDYIDKVYEKYQKH